jgi:hypothetical protein
MSDIESDLRCDVFDCMLPEPTSDRYKLKNAILSEPTRERYLMRSFMPQIRGRSQPTHWRDGRSSGLMRHVLAFISCRCFLACLGRICLISTSRHCSFPPTPFLRPRDLPWSGIGLLFSDCGSCQSSPCIIVAARYFIAHKIDRMVPFSVDERSDPGRTW